MCHGGAYYFMAFLFCSGRNKRIYIIPNLPLAKGGMFTLYQEGIKGCVSLFGEEGQCLPAATAAQAGEIFQ
jgi:hypothetical protein